MAGKLKPTGKKARAGIKTRAEKKEENKKIYAAVKSDERDLLNIREDSMLPMEVTIYQGHYTNEIAELVCDLIGNGISLKRVCQVPGMPTRQVVMKWTREDEHFESMYTRAKIGSTEAMADDILDIADDGSNDFMEDGYMRGKTPGYRVDGENINRSKLRVETRKFLMAALKPKKYGAHTDLTTNGKDLPAQILGMINVNQQENTSRTILDDISET